MRSLYQSTCILRPLRTFTGSLRFMSNKPPPVPRPSASLVVLNAKNEVLLVQRNPKARAFGGVHVFPGGNADAKQDGDSKRMTAIRETFEEAGLLFAAGNSSQIPTGTVLNEARKAIHSQKMQFSQFLESHALAPAVDSLMPFTQWITPPNAFRRFHTHFFITFMDLALPSDFTSGVKQDQIPTPDGGQEVISARFIHPTDALAEFHQGKITFMPPQYYILTTLSEIFRGNSAVQIQRERITTLAHGAFGSMVMNPRSLPDLDEKGRTVLTYEGDETRSGKKGRLHRSLVKTAKGGVVTTEIELQRNFDIFTDIEPDTSTPSSKL